MHWLVWKSQYHVLSVLKGLISSSNKTTRSWWHWLCLLYNKIASKKNGCAKCKNTLWYSLYKMILWMSPPGNKIAPNAASFLLSEFSSTLEALTPYVVIAAVRQRQGDEKVLLAHYQQWGGNLVTLHKQMSLWVCHIWPVTFEHVTVELMP